MYKTFAYILIVPKKNTQHIVTKNSLERANKIKVNLISLMGRYILFIRAIDKLFNCLSPKQRDHAV